MRRGKVGSILGRKLAHTHEVCVHGVASARPSTTWEPSKHALLSVRLWEIYRHDLDSTILIISSPGNYLTYNHLIHIQTLFLVLLLPLPRLMDFHIFKYTSLFLSWIGPRESKILGSYHPMNSFLYTFLLVYYLFPFQLLAHFMSSREQGRVISGIIMTCMEMNKSAQNTNSTEKCTL